MINGPSPSITSYKVNFLGIAARYPSVHLLTAETVACDVFLESEEKGLYEEIF